MLAWSTTFSNAHKISKNVPAKTVSMYLIHLLGFEFGITNLFLYSQPHSIPTPCLAPHDGGEATAYSVYHGGA